MTGFIVPIRSYLGEWQGFMHRCPALPSLISLAVHPSSQYSQKVIRGQQNARQFNEGWPYRFSGLRACLWLRSRLPCCTYTWVTWSVTFPSSAHVQMHQPLIPISQLPPHRRPTRSGLLTAFIAASPSPVVLCLLALLLPGLPLGICFTSCFIPSSPACPTPSLSSELLSADALSKSVPEVPLKWHSPLLPYHLSGVGAQLFQLSWNGIGGEAELRKSLLCKGRPWGNWPAANDVQSG